MHLNTKSISSQLIHIQFYIHRLTILNTLLKGLFTVSYDVGLFLVHSKMTLTTRVRQSSQSGDRGVTQERS